MHAERFFEEEDKIFFGRGEGRGGGGKVGGKTPARRQWVPYYIRGIFFGPPNFSRGGSVFRLEGNLSPSPHSRILILCSFVNRNERYEDDIIDR